MGANIIIDGKKCGTTPRVLNNIMIGNHELKLEKEGYVTITKKIALEEKSIMSIKERMFLNNNEVTATEVVTENAEESKPEQLKAMSSNEYTRYNFVTLNGAYSNYGDLTYGLTIGRVNKIGWFISVMTNFNFGAFSTDFECDENLLVNGNLPVYSGNEAFTGLSVIGGVIIRISAPIALRVGAGYGVRNTAYETVDGKR